MEEVNGLIKNSKYSARIMELLSTTNINKLSATDSFGALFYVLGLEDRLLALGSRKLEKFIEESCEYGKEPDGIVVFNSVGGTEHCGLYLSEVSGRNIMFHQPGQGKNYEVAIIKKYLEKAMGITSHEYYRVKKHKGLELPEYHAEKPERVAA